MSDDPGTVEQAVRELYAGDPSDFVATRSDLSAAARKAGDADAARSITALRKPTAAAAVVNRQVHADPTVVDRLRDVGDRLRDAQGAGGDIDPDLLRELSLERRRVVREIADAALDAFAPSSGTGIRDEVAQTVDAAVADPDVAERLGRLEKAERWSGFGVAASGTPGPAALTVLRGGKGTAGRPAVPKPEDSQTRKRRRRLGAAEDELAAAEQELSRSTAAEQAARTRMDELSARLAEVQDQLDAAAKDAKEAGTAARAARSRHREAKRARDRLRR